MNSAKVIMILALCLTMKATTGQLPANCYCHLANNVSDYCATRGCSVGTNSHCNNNDFCSFPYNYANFRYIRGVIYFYVGCNCLKNSFNCASGYEHIIQHLPSFDE
jgi:hypothetical protein